MTTSQNAVRHGRLLPVAAAAIALAAIVACGDDTGGPRQSPIEPTRVTVPGRGGDAGPGVSDTEIRLGMTADLAAVGDTPFRDIAAAVQAYFAKVNEEDEGVCARDVVLVTRDDQNNPELALEGARKLVEEDVVVGLIGGIGMAQHAPVASYLNDPNVDGNAADGVPDLFALNGWSGWGDAARFLWTVALAPDYVTDARAQTSYMNASLAGKKAAIIYQDDDFGKDYLRGIQETIASRDLLVSEQALTAESDPKALVLAARDAGAELVMLAVTAKTTADAIKLAGGDGYRPQWFVSYVNSPTAIAREIGGGLQAEQLAVGFQLLAGALSSAWLLSAVDDSESPAMLEHQRIMEAYVGPDVSSLTVQGQTLAEAAVESLNRSCDDLTREGVLRGAESLQRFPTSLMLPGTTINLAAADHYAVQSLEIVRIQGDGRSAGIGRPVSFDPVLETAEE